MHYRILWESSTVSENQWLVCVGPHGERPDNYANLPVSRCLLARASGDDDDDDDYNDKNDKNTSKRCQGDNWISDSGLV